MLRFPQGAAMRKSEQAQEKCKTVSAVQKMLAGKYKLELLWYIGRLHRCIGEITESALTKQLRALEADGFIVRHDFYKVPPHVEYSLSARGESFLSVMDTMKEWGERWL